MISLEDIATVGFLVKSIYLKCRFSIYNFFCFIKSPIEIFYGK